jgi:hypothetical protein
VGVLDEQQGVDRLAALALLDQRELARPAFAEWLGAEINDAGAGASISSLPRSLAATTGARSATIRRATTSGDPRRSTSVSG